MKFIKRLIMSYTVLAILTSFFVGGIYTYYTERWWNAELESNIKFICNEVVSRSDVAMLEMEQAYLSILSEEEVLQAIRSLSKLMQKPEENMLAINEMKSVISSKISTAYYIDRFYRIIVFNDYGYIVASTNMNNRVVNIQKDVDSIEWIDDVRQTYGESVYVALHPDDWGVGDNVNEVFSLVKEIQGDSLGYIEIQKSKSALEEMFALQDENMKIVVIDANDNVIYSTNSGVEKNYQQYLDNEDSVFQQINEETKEYELIAIAKSTETGNTIILTEEWEVASEAIPSTVNIATIMGALYFIVSLVFIICTAKILTKPLRKLREQIEQTNLSNITREIKVESIDEDVHALTKAYQELLERLVSSMEKEKQISVLQLQTQFDTLQAQVNPHFLYNTLNVIANRGMLNNDEETCNICGNLATMFRYATNTNQRFATIEEEMKYLEHYIHILKSRFEERLEVTITIDSAINHEVIPKICFQQLVENSIEHGFKNTDYLMKIEIIGYKTDKGWIVEVHDNGSGVTLDKISEIEEKMHNIRTKIEEMSESLQMELGGMGIINTYGRMFVQHREHTVFRLENHENSGTIVTIGVELEEGRGDK